MKKKISLLLMTLLVLGSSISVCAEEGTRAVTETGSQAVTVEYAKASTFTVTIPKTITLGSETKSADYTVTVSGDMKLTEVVNVVPSPTVTMTDAKGKADVTGTVTQEKTQFTSEECATGATVQGNITASDLTAGVWSGTLSFDISTTPADGV